MTIHRLIDNVNIATIDAGLPSAYGKIADGCVVFSNGKIVWVGEKAAAPDFGDVAVIDGKGGWLTPGLIDCHTHIIYGGNRADEFEQRLQGVSYEQIARRGGGIKRTVAATREASDENLYEAAAKRLRALTAEGVSTIEIKSGYGLDLDTELRMLRVARRLGREFSITVRTTFLGAHALPPEYQGRADEYIDFVCASVLPEAAAQGLADAVDVFCEGIGFSPTQCRRVFAKATALGLAVKGHVEQLSNLGGAKLVSEFNGLSVDHLEYLQEEDLAELKANDVVPVLLPGAFYFLNETQKPPLDAMRRQQLPMAVATDLNPGSSPCASLLTAMNQACVLFALTPQEALAGATRNAAKALGLHNEKGQIKAGFDADLLLWDIDHPAQLSYEINLHRPTHIWIGGNPVDT